MILRFYKLLLFTKACKCPPFLYPSYLKLQGGGYVRSPQSHSLSMLMGIHSLAAYLQLQVVWV
ncbi:hypothetical protein EXA13_12090 [Vibrio cincinnatiensis]|nr:hypothetical protein [Vibrio cincinnatiensis]